MDNTHCSILQHLPKALHTMGCRTTATGLQSLQLPLPGSGVMLTDVRDCHFKPWTKEKSRGSDGYLEDLPKAACKTPCKGAPPPRNPSLANASGEGTLGRNNRNVGTQEGCKQSKSLALQW